MQFILFIAIVILFVWVGVLSGRIKELELKLKYPLHPSPQAPPVTPEKILPVPSPLFNQPEHFTPVPQAKLEVKPQLTEDQQADRATGWLNKIGVVALLLGMVFFFKYAIDQGWINAWGRIIIGFVVAGLLVYLGGLWKEKYGNRAHALSGGGIALFYFTIFAAYQYYHLMPQPVAWLLMLLVAALSVWLSFKYSSLTLGILGFFGAYGSPLMLGSGQDNQTALFVFLTLMNVTVLAINYKKFWVELLFLALLGTVIDFSAWAGNYSTQANTFNSLFFIILSTAIFSLACSGLVRLHKNKNSLPEMFSKNLSAVYLMAGAFYWVASWMLLEKNFHDMLPAIGLLGSVIFFIAYAVVDRLEYRFMNYCLSFVGSGLLVYAAIWQYEGKALAFALLIIALLGTTLGFLLKREELRVWALCVLFISVFKSLFEPYEAIGTHFLFNAKFGLMFANTVAMIIIGWIYSKFKPSEFEKNAEAVLQYTAAIILWIAVTWDMYAGFAGHGDLVANNVTSFWWIIYPAVLCAVAAMSKRSGLMKLGIILLCASVFKVLILPYGTESEFLLNAKFGLMVLQTIALFFIGFVNSGNQESKESGSETLYVIGSLFLWFSVSWEIIEYFNGNSQNLLLSLWWIVYAVILMVVSSALKMRVFRKVSLALFALAIVKVFLYDVQALDTPFRIIAFIVLGVILLSVSFIYNKNKTKIVNFIEGDNNNSNNELKS